MAADNQEVGERPVREQLKKARIGNSSDEAAPASDVAAMEGEQGEATEASRLQKKRSFEDLEDAPAQETATAGGRHHTRKRSREGTIGEDSNGNKRKVSGEKQRDEPIKPQTSGTNGVAKPAAAERPGTPDHAGDKRPEGAVEEMASPKIKRSRLHSTTAEGNAEENAAAPAQSASSDPATATTTEETTTKVPPGSAFANASAASPFSSLSGNKSSASAAPAQTSSSAFASSNLSAFASSTKSPFETLGKSSGGFGVGGGFGSGTKSPLGADAPKAEDKAAGSSFGGSLGQQSAFATTANAGSSFGGKLGQSGGFGSSIGGTGFTPLGGPQLTSFASGKTTPLSGATKAAKPFGAPADDEDEAEEAENGEDDESGVKSPLASEEDPQDERFYKQDIETGEETETTEITCRAKLYNWVTLADGKKEWRERGLGVLRLNVKAPDPDAGDDKPQARFLMRADGSHRVMLNTPVKKEIKFGGPSGEEPKNGTLFFMGTIDGKTSVEFLQLRVSLRDVLILCVVCANSGDPR